MMNRVCFVIDKNGELAGIAADSPVEVYIVNPNCKRDRVYLYGCAEFGPEHVRALIGGYPVGHLNDGMLGIGDQSKLPPSKPTLTVVP